MLDKIFQIPPFGVILFGICDSVIYGEIHFNLLFKNRKKQMSDVSSTPIEVLVAQPTIEEW